MKAGWFSRHTKQRWRALRVVFCRNPWDKALELLPDEDLSPHARLRRVGGTHFILGDLRGDRPSTVLVVGGYLGDVTAGLRQVLDCQVIVCEPVGEFFSSLESRFKDDLSVAVHPIGLSDTTRQSHLVIDGDASRACSDGDEGSVVDLVDAATFLRGLDVPIDVLWINAEGAEYEILPTLSDHGLMPDIPRVIVQFHSFVASADRRRLAIRERLAETHDEDWCFEFVWESWSRRSD